MKKSDLCWAGICLMMISLSACATEDAAMVGALVGRGLGRPLGGVAVAVDETFDPAEDVQRANPRYQNNSRLAPGNGAKTMRPTAVRSWDRRSADDSDIHVYKTEVRIETRGPAQIESLEIADAEDVTDFWR